MSVSNDNLEGSIIGLTEDSYKNPAMSEKDYLENVIMNLSLYVNPNKTIGEHFDKAKSLGVHEGVESNLLNYICSEIRSGSFYEDFEEATKKTYFRIELRFPYEYAETKLQKHWESLCNKVEVYLKQKSEDVYAIVLSNKNIAINDLTKLLKTNISLLFQEILSSSERGIELVRKNPILKFGDHQLIYNSILSSLVNSELPLENLFKRYSVRITDNPVFWYDIAIDNIALKFQWDDFNDENEILLSLKETIEEQENYKFSINKEYYYKPLEEFCKVYLQRLSLNKKSDKLKAQKEVSENENGKYIVVLPKTNNLGSSNKALFCRYFRGLGDYLNGEYTTDEIKSLYDSKFACDRKIDFKSKQAYGVCLNVLVKEGIISSKGLNMISRYRFSISGENIIHGDDAIKKWRSFFYKKATGKEIVELRSIIVLDKDS